MSDGTQNVLIPLPCPLCGGEPEVRKPDSLMAQIICSGTGHAVAAYGKTVEEALAVWNQRSAPAAPQASGDLDEYRKAWNDNRGPLPQATKLTGQRLDKLRRRIKEGLTLEDFKRAAWTCSHTDFLLRGNPGKQHFHATFDWLIQDSGTVTRVLEGQYGPTGKTEAELREEAAEKEKSEAFKSHEMMAHLSIRRRLAPQSYGHVKGNLLRNVEAWEISARECIAKLDAGDTTIPPELVTIVRNWQKRMEEVTTDTTATSE